MNFKEKIQQDLKNALKEKRELEVLVLRLLQGAILNKEKEKRYKLSQKEPGLKEEELAGKSKLSTDEEIIEAVLAEAKKRKEAIVEFEKGRREDLVSKETQELEILKRYLPEQLSEEEIRKLVKEAIAKTGAKGIKEMGKVMADLAPKTKGRADGALLSRIVKEMLSSEK